MNYASAPDDVLIAYQKSGIDEKTRKKIQKIVDIHEEENRPVHIHKENPERIR